MKTQLLCFFIFYNAVQCETCGHKRNPWYARFTHPEFKHCEILCFNGNGWVKFDSKGRNLNHYVYQDDGSTVLEKIKEDPNVTHIIGADIYKKVSRKWFGLKADLCNSDAAKIAGVDIGITFTPYQLYKKLLLTFKKNFNVNTVWSRYG